MNLTYFCAILLDTHPRSRPEFLLCQCGYKVSVKYHFIHLSILLAENHLIVSLCDRNSCQVIHRKGLAWKFVRASMSLAGYLPPVSEDNVSLGSSS